MSSYVLLYFLHVSLSCCAFLCAFLDYSGLFLLQSSEVCSGREDLNSNANGNAKAKAKANAQESFPRASKSLRVQKHAANREI